MKNYHIILKEDGLYLEDLPEEPNVKNYPSVLDGERYIKDSEDYQKAVQQAITYAVKLKDQDLGMDMIRKILPVINQSGEAKWTPNKNEPYKVDLSGYEEPQIKSDYQVKFNGVNWESTNGDEWEDWVRLGSFMCRIIEVAILTPKKEESSAHSFTEGSDIGDDFSKGLSRTSSANELRQPSVTEESQVDLLTELENDIREALDQANGHMVGADDVMVQIRKFTIIRNP